MSAPTPCGRLLSILLIAVPVTLILTLIGLSHGFLDDSAKRTQRRGRGYRFSRQGQFADEL